jgi:hypothetical protein
MVITMKKSKALTITIIGLIGIILITCLFLFLGRESDKPNSHVGDFTDVNISVTISEDSSNTDDTMITLPEINAPDDNNINVNANVDYTDSTEISTQEPKVENGSEEDVTDKIPETISNTTRDKVELDTKDFNDQQTGPSAGEDRNDIIIKDKEDSISQTEDEQKDVIVENEIVSIGENKDEVIEIDEGTITEGNNKNGPEYKPSVGGDNPFDDDIKTNIDDNPVENYIGNGEDRPGGGIHF